MHLPLSGIPPILDRLIESSWQACLLVFLVLAIQTLLRRQLTPAWRHALWWIVLGRLLIFVPPSSSWSLFNFVPSPWNPGRSAEGAIVQAQEWRTIVPHPSREPLTTGRLQDSGLERTFTVPPPTVPFTIGSVMAWVWGVGAFLFLGRLLVQNHIFMRRIRAGMRPAHSSRIERLEACRRRMGVGRSVELLEGDEIPTPAVYGLFRIRLLLPRRLAQTESTEALDYIFLHELAHVRRGDLWIHALTRVLLALHWFNPILHWAFRKIRLDRELATDALALQVAGPEAVRGYGTTILDLLEKGCRSPAPFGTVGILEDNVSLERRIRAIAHFRPASRWTPVSSILVAVLAATCWTGAQAPDWEMTNPESIRPRQDAPLHQRLVGRAIRLNLERLESSLGLESTWQIRQTNIFLPPMRPVTDGAPVLLEKIRQLFQDHGVSLKPPNKLLVNNFTGMLIVTVHGTPEEIEAVEQGVEMFNDDTVPVWMPVTQSFLAADDLVQTHHLIVSADGPWTLNGQWLHPVDCGAHLRHVLARQPAAPAVIHIQQWHSEKPAFRDVMEAIDLAKAAGFTNINLTSPPGKVVAQIQIVRSTHLHRVSEDLILTYISSKPGELLSREKIDADVRRLYESGLFNQVRVEERIAASGIVLQFSVSERPLLKEIKIAGNTKLKNETIATYLTSRVGTPVDEQKFFRDTQNIVQAYEDAGIAPVKVTYGFDLDRESGEAVVRFDIVE
jgi:beta-lactamase regulating signal transducer with metallopeptidase domain